MAHLSAISACLQRMTLWVSKTGDNLMSQPTLSRLENAPSWRELGRMGLSLIDLFYTSFMFVLARMVLDTLREERSGTPQVGSVPSTGRQLRRDGAPGKSSVTGSAAIVGFAALPDLALPPKFAWGAAIVPPVAMLLLLRGVSQGFGRVFSPRAHAVLLVDQAGWHTTGKLVIPPNISLLLLPPRSPELNPVENIWQFIRENWLSNRVFNSYDDIVALSCEAWNKLIDQPWKIMSIGRRKWAHGF